jgi:hypothetical protein
LQSKFQNCYNNHRSKSFFSFFIKLGAGGYPKLGGIDNLIINEERLMKKIITISAGLLLALSTAAFAAEEHGKAALEHANAAAKGISAAECKQHAGVAIEHALASALVLKSAAKNHMESASHHLEEAVNHGNMGHMDVCKQHVDAAITEIQAANK